MDGLARAVGDGIGGMVSRSMTILGDVLHGVVNALNDAVPGGGAVLVGGAIVILILGWNVLRRA